MRPVPEVIPGVVLPVVVYAKDQPEYIPLPAHRQDDGTITIRWKLTWSERARIFLGGSIWHQILTFNGPLQPQKLSAECPIKIEEKGESKP